MNEQRSRNSQRLAKATPAPRRHAAFLPAVAAAALLALPAVVWGITPTANIEVTPASVKFGTLAIGSASESELVKIAEIDGGTDLDLGKIKISGSAADDYTVRDPNGCAKSTIVKSGNCKFEVTFAPSDSGTRNATITVLVENLTYSNTNDTVSLTGKGATAEGSAPTTPALTYPEDGAKNIPTSLTFEWDKSDDDDGDDVTYEFIVCDDPLFSGCSSETVTGLRHRGALIAGLLGGAALLLLGIVLPGGAGRRGLLVLALVGVLGTATLLGACASSGGGGSSTVSTDVTGLDSSTKYYWKVRADDGNGNTVVSDVYSFKTK